MCFGDLSLMGAGGQVATLSQGESENRGCKPLVMPTWNLVYCAWG